jgi:hypothetical protein
VVGRQEIVKQKSPSYIFHHLKIFLLNSSRIGRLSSSHWWNKNTRMCKEKQYIKQKINTLNFSWTYHVSLVELLPLQILYIFVSPLSAFGHNTSILVVGSFHHTSRSIHLISFTISNCLYWIHLELVHCQVAHISIWSIGSSFYQLAGSLVYHRLRFLLLLVVRKWWNKNTRMCKEKQINETENLK